MLAVSRVQPSAQSHIQNAGKLGGSPAQTPDQHGCRYRRDLEEENFEGETYQKLDAEADALSRGKNVEREVLDRVKQEVSDTMDMGAMDAEARDRYLLDVANEIDMGELEARAREQYKKGKTCPVGSWASHDGRANLQEPLMQAS